MEEGFAIWITGLPASGKSTLTQAILRALSSRGIRAAVLESDALREVLTPHPRYDEAEREIFYGAMAHIGKLLTEHGVPVIFDATANRRAYRDRARAQIARFLEVYLDCPLAFCVARDPKGIYRKGRTGQSTSVPGIQADYEPPNHPDVVVHGDRESSETGAGRVLEKLAERGYIKSGE